MKKVFWLMFIVIIAGSLGYAYYHHQNMNANALILLDQPRMIAVEEGPLQITVSSEGTVISNLDVEIKCKASGEVIGLPFDVSDTVNKGDLLVEIDPVDEERNVRQARVRLNSSLAKLEQARTNLAFEEQKLEKDRQSALSGRAAARIDLDDKRRKAERASHLFKSSTMHEADYETALANAELAKSALTKAEIAIEQISLQVEALDMLRQAVTLAQSDVESDQIALEQAEQRLSETKVYAPFDGVVSSREVEVRQIVVSPTNNVSGGSALLTLSDLSRIFVMATIPESEIGQVDIGQPVEIRVDAYPFEQFEGTVERIAIKGENISNVVTFDTKIEIISDNKHLLKPGMTASADIVVASSERALLLPAQAIKWQGRQSFVTLPNPDPEQQPLQHEITVGLTDGVQTEVVSGLELEQQVLLTAEHLRSRWAQGDRGGGGQGGGRQPGLSPRMLMRLR